MNADRRTDSASKECGIGRDIVSAIAAIATGSFHANHDDLGGIDSHQLREVCTEDMGVLGPCPNAQARCCCACRSLPIRPFRIFPDR